MARYIKLSEEQIQQSVVDFQEAVKNIPVVNGEIVFKKSFSIPNRKATIFFTAQAYVKMLCLIKEFSTEVAWYGAASRIGDEDDDTYLIYDILVYPQSVSGAYVAMDEVEHAKWYVDLAKNEDQRIENLFAQCHSHVNMGVTPSGKDNDTIKTFLSQTSDDGFFISMIWNKSLSSWVNIFDKKKNIQFENSDIAIDILCQSYDGSESMETVSGFLAESRKLAPSTTYATGSSYSKPAYAPSASSSQPAKAAETKEESLVPIDKSKTEKSASGWKNDRGGKSKKDYDDDEEWYRDHFKFYNYDR